MLELLFSAGFVRRIGLDERMDDDEETPTDRS